VKVTALAGGVGGAKLVNGLMKILPKSDFSVIVNTGDDFYYSGLYISPDLDSVLYTCAGINNLKTGWGLNSETWNVREGLKALGHPVWFNLGDKDLATHIERTRLLNIGWSLTEVTAVLAEKLHVAHTVYPMTDSKVSTILDTKELGRIPFQEYFVKYRCEPEIKRIIFDGVENATLSQSATRQLQESELVIFAPSNPFVSIGPILAIPGVLALLREKTVVAVSPLIVGQAIKGPAAKMMTELGYTPGSKAVAKFYTSIIDGLIIDSKDLSDVDEIRQCGIIPYVEDIFMPDSESQIRLARKTLQLSKMLMREKQK
jgi:LPPG:FO 2-phospho-L-lactate transferase